MSALNTAPQGEEAPLLEVIDLTKRFGGRRRPSRAGDEGVKAVDGVSFTVRRGETVGLVGESGSGKSTTGYCILRLLDASSGTIRFDGEDITHLAGKGLRELRRRMQVIFQDPLASHNPRMSVGDIIAEPMVVHRVGTAASRAAEARRLLDLVGLPSSAMDRRPHEFSGGQCQRISIARALTLKPSLLICDEPVSALDVSVQAQVLNLLKDLQDELGLAYLFIAHDLAVVRSISDRIVVMQAGRIVESGPATEVYDSPQHEYTRRLLAAAPVADPVVMRQRRVERRAAAVAAR
ncbi:MAG TPA: ATP-binding cassette domain-containing protein [Modestobacter sp.]|jgi:oligopeptide transport system ATP-binding protein|nr:ATP-binding cassette domain-containing protein [Modestobacter sp.]